MILNAFAIMGSIGDTLTNATGVAKDGIIAKHVFGLFSENIFNWIGLFVAAICYGLTKELNEVSTFGYILSNSSPTEY